MAHFARDRGRLHRARRPRYSAYAEDVYDHGAPAGGPAGERYRASRQRHRAARPECPRASEWRPIGRNLGRAGAAGRHCVKSYPAVKPSDDAGRPAGARERQADRQYVAAQSQREVAGSQPLGRHCQCLRQCVRRSRTRFRAIRGRCRAWIPLARAPERTGKDAVGANPAGAVPISTRLPRCDRPRAGPWRSHGFHQSAYRPAHGRPKRGDGASR